jgi:hypothetical protein
VRRFTLIMLVVLFFLLVVAAFLAGHVGKRPTPTPSGGGIRPAPTSPLAS